MDYGILNNAVDNAFAEKVSVQTSVGTFSLQGVFSLPTEQKTVGNQSVEVPDPFFEFNITEFTKTGAGINDSIVRSGVIYTIVLPPQFTHADVMRVTVRQM